jgi:hypothetical protein
VGPGDVLRSAYWTLSNATALRIAGGKGSWPSAQFSLALEDRVTEERSDDDAVRVLLDLGPIGGWLRVA